MKVIPLKLGTLHMRQESIFGRGFPADEFIDVPVWSVLIEHEDGVVLVDTGCCQIPHGIPENEGVLTYSDEDVITRRLAQYGHSPDDISHVIMTHLHIDHAGNLHIFKNASIYVDEAEYVETMYNYGHRIIMGGTPRSQLDLWSDDLRVEPLRRERTELLRGVTAVRFPRGHAFGSLAILFEGKRNILIASDLAYTKSAFDRNPPVIVTDTEGYFAGLDKLSALAAEFSAEIWYGHDPEQFAAINGKTFVL